MKENSKIPPNSKESEMIVLGSMLTSLDSLNVACDMLDDSDFYYTEHKAIFQVLKSAYRQDKPADIHLMAEELKRQNKLDSIGGVAYLTALAQYAGTSAYIEEYAHLVRNKAVLRRMISAAQLVEKEALDDPQDVHGILDNAQQRFFEISQVANPLAGITVKELLSGEKGQLSQPYLEELQKRQEQFQTRRPGESSHNGITTHFIDLDKLVDGFSPSNLMILAARPAMGKTALALNIAENICFKNGMPVGIFSLEMTADQLLHRLICSQSEVESEKIKSGSLSGLEYQRVVSAVNFMQKHVMVIDDQPGLKITDLRARARRMKESYGIGLLIVDYLQLLSGSGSVRSLENRQNEISEISRMLKTLARELNLPVLCLSQLSRKVEERTGHRPMMSDLRESGCLAAESLIPNAETGELHTIKELALRAEQTPIWVYGVDENQRLGPYRLIKAFSSGCKPLFRLTTSQGQSIRASSNHPFLTKEGWKRLDQLAIGESLALAPQFMQAKALQAEVSSFCCSGPSSLFAPHHLHWGEIQSIEPAGIEEVFDVTVEQVHNFVANGLVVHNSLEQDADLVMFLLRREYYDPYDKPGLAEVIVAKNRHGGIGVVNLAFRKEIAQFANYTPLETSGQKKDREDAFAAFSPD